ncbi:MAG: hypothetical protein AAF974_03035 [Cyanobacteria bacterium P01_E01_bin.34]
MDFGVIEVMRRYLKQLRTILEHQLQPYSCLVEIQERGPILSIMVRYIPGAAPDSPSVQSIVRSGLDAVFAPDIQTVNLYALPLREDDAEPQRLASFTYQGVEGDEGMPEDTRRQEYLLFRLILLILGVLGLVVFLFTSSIDYLVAAIVAIGLTLAFGVCKRSIERTPPLVQRGVVLVGSFLIGAGLVFLTRTFPEAFSATAIAVLIGVFAIRLGWR